jgi:hypothetical protein
LPCVIGKISETYDIIVKCWITSQQANMPIIHASSENKQRSWKSIKLASTGAPNKNTEVHEVDQKSCNKLKLNHFWIKRDATKSYITCN